MAARTSKRPASAGGERVSCGDMWILEKGVIMRESTVRNQDKIKLLLFSLGYLAVQFSIMILDHFHISGYNGVLMAFEFVFCLLMVRVDYRYGVYLTYGLMGFSMLTILRVILL